MNKILTRKEWLASLKELVDSYIQKVDEQAACKHEWFSTGAMEPGQMRCIHCGMWSDEVDDAPPHCEAGPEFCGQCLKESMPIKSRRQWQGLTNEEIIQVSKTMLGEPGRNGYVLAVAFARTIEAKIKEKNTGVSK